MVYQPLICGELPYTAELWECEDFPLHWHDEIEVVLCICGCLEITVEGTQFTLCRDDALIIAGKEAHALRVCEEGSQIVYLEFGYALLGKRFRSLQNVRIVPPLFSITDPHISATLIKPLLEIRSLLLEGRKNVGREFAIQGDLYLLSAYLMDHAQQLAQGCEAQEARASLLRDLTAILYYVEEHYSEKITTDRAAEIMGYEKTYFCKQFKQATGMSFHQYLNYYRISLSTLYLTDHMVPVSVVSEQVGFSSPKLFCRVFKDFTKLTPTEYRQLRPEKQFVVWPKKLK